MSWCCNALQGQEGCWRTSCGEAVSLQEYSSGNVIPRGVAVGFEVAKALRTEFDIVVSRKIGAEHNPELAAGAVAGDGSSYIDEAVVKLLGYQRGICGGEGEAGKERGQKKNRGIQVGKEGGRGEGENSDSRG